MDRREQLLEELAKIDLMIEMEKAKTEYSSYVKYVHRYDKEFKLAKFQEYICDCIDKLLNNELLNEEGKPYEGICLWQPPQTGKSRCITETLPSYYLGRFPFNHVIEISYGEDLAVKFGRRNKQKIEEFGRQLFAIELSKQSSSALEFEIAKTNGGMISRGIGGQITGSPADCFPKGTMIATEIGEIEISQLLGMVNTPRILTYDHTSDTIVLRNIVARRVKYAKEFTIIKTARGREVKSTSDHRYYERRKGYTKAQLLRRDDVLYSIKQEDMSYMWTTEEQKKQNMSVVLSQVKGRLHDCKMFKLWGRNKKENIRIREIDTERNGTFLLRCKMYARRIQKNVFSKMSCVWETCKTWQQILFKAMHKLSKNTYKSEKKLSDMWEGISTEKFKNNILQPNLCKQSPLGKNEREKQFTLQNGNKLCKTIQRNAKNNTRERWEQVCLLWNSFKNRTRGRQNEHENTSYRRRCKKQYSRELNNNVRYLSCDTPQIEYDTVSGIENISGESIEVYDIQIEETHNFFANGILVHNCIIVDDPYKNRQEADSQLYKKFVNDEWLNTIQTRASSKCKYIVVHTRWNEDDLIGTLLEQEPDKWFEISFPAIAEQDELETSGRKIGEGILPEAGKDAEWFLNKRKSYEKDATEGGIRAWNALYQGRPSSLEGNMIKREYWQRFDLTLDMQKQGFFPVKIQSWDCALKDTSDPVAGQVWGKRGANNYLIDHKGGRMDIVKTMNGIIAWDKKYPDATAKLIEDKANGPAAIRMLRNKIHGLIPVNPGTKSKTERVNVVLPLFMAGNVFIPKRIEVSPGVFVHCEWAEEIIEQCAAFKPDKKVQRDDEVDSMSMALGWLMWREAKANNDNQVADAFGLHKQRNDDWDFGEITQDYVEYGV